MSKNEVTNVCNAGSNCDAQFEQYQRLLTAIEENHQKDLKKMYIFFLIVFIVFLIVVGLSLVFIDGSLVNELRSGNTSVMKNTDYLELTVPILLALAGGLVAFLGVNRLKDMDTQVNQMRAIINSELDKEISRVAALRSDLAEHIDVAVNNRTQSFAAEMEGKLDSVSKDGEKRVAECRDKALAEIESSKVEINNEFCHAKEGLNDFESRYGWLLSSRETTSDVFLNEVATVYDVHRIVESMWDCEVKPDNIAELTKRYVDKVTDVSAKLRGDEEDYHNLSAECARHSLFGLSCEVCEAGLSYFPNNIDLLSDWINYGTKIGSIDVVADGPLVNLLRIDKNLWNWRAFSFTVNYYIAAGKLEEAEVLADEFVRYYPFEERAYYCKSDVYLCRYAKEEGLNKAIDILQTAVNQGINCPMCASRLAEIFSDCGRLDEALEAANRAIQELSQEQPSVNYGYVIYRRALILDRMAYRSEIGESAACDFAKRSALDYSLAIQSGRLSPITSRQAKVRLRMLSTYFKIDGMDYIDTPISLEGLSNLLEQYIE